MKNYRTYLLDADRRLQLGEGFASESDSQAIARLATARIGANGVELWEGGRPVAQLGPDGLLHCGVPRPAEAFTETRSAKA